jgi:hypothetical protein
MDFNQTMKALVREVVGKVDSFSHIQPERLLVSATFNRSSRKAGLLAYVLPLKYRAGSPVERRVRGPKEYHWAMLPVQHAGIEILYIVYFMLPRFLHLSSRDKLETVVHELYHISPQFNGDLRRFKGRSVLHGCHKEYDRKVKQLTDGLLAKGVDPRFNAFLNLGKSDGDLLEARHIPEPRPKLLKVAYLPATENRTF